ncbi:MAG: PDZ domain-containing protein [Actinomycetota bacterium]
MSAWLRRWRAWAAAAGVAALLAVVLLLPLPAFVESPGSVVTLGGCVDVHAEDAVPLRGDFLLTSVALGRATPATAALAWLREDQRVRAEDRVVRRDVPDAEHFDGQRRVFARSAQSAAALGLRAAGFGADPERLVGDGAVVTGVLDGAPAEGVLRRGDVIVGVDGAAIRTDAELRALLDDTDEVEVRFTRDGRPREVTITPVELVVDGEERVILGVRLETLNARVDLPVPVDVTSGRIGGPSAGLMIALAVYDQSDPTVDLAAGRRVAGTGTLTSQGAVGRVGGIGLKALAAAERRADVFLAPASQAEEAAALLPAGTGLEVVAVTTFEDAVQTLLDTAEPGESYGPPSDPQCPLRPAA